MAIVTDWYRSLERQREKTSMTRGDYASRVREQRNVSEPIETNLRVSQLGRVRIFKGGMGLKLSEFANLTLSEQSVFYSGCDRSCT